MPRITSREHLLNTLAEAAELEHNLLCIYLYAAFSLKDESDSELTSKELACVQSWKKVIQEIAIQEMGHLAMVSNIIVSIGGNAHFNRPNFPISPAYYPDKFIMNLRPFNLETLEHFIFLERPADSHLNRDPLADTIPYAPKRETPEERLMTYNGNYKTVGEIYESIKEGILFLCHELGEEILFCGSPHNQLTSEETKMSHLKGILNATDAIECINYIVEQGEGGDCVDCHFKKFSAVYEEYKSLLKGNPEFSPSRPVVTNPVMRRNSETDETCWIDHPESSIILDCANSLYNLMLRFLSQIYFLESRDEQDKKTMIDCTFIIMKVMGGLSTLLTRSAAKTSGPSMMSGMTFSIDRYVNAVELKNEKLLLRERLHEIILQMQSIEGHDRMTLKLKSAMDSLS